ncbi:hypothetical protein DS891_24410 [Pseudoalteromonas sp. JC28]|nr:hypothetical protein [Pseudoalteromonas sp. JC28]
MLAFKEKPLVEWPRYAIAYPRDFHDLIELQSPRFVRALFSKNHESKKYIHLLGNSQSKRSTNFSAFKSATSRYVLGVLKSKSEAVNCYFTPNEFFSWPRCNNLALLRANWLEIDLDEKCHAESVRDLEITIVADVFARIEESGLPPPTGYVLSGSGGIHIYWIYDPVDAKAMNKSLWRTIANCLIERLGNSVGNWHIDLMATKRVSGYMRIPGSVHGRTGLSARYFGSGPKYTFEELLTCLGLGSLHNRLLQLEQKRIVDLASYSKNTEVKRGPKKRYGHSIKEWWMKCINTIQMHFNQIGMVPKGKRDKTAFERLYQFNAERIGLPDDELDNLIKTAKTTLYRYRQETLALYLEDLLGFRPEYLIPKVK